MPTGNRKPGYTFPPSGVMVSILKRIHHGGILTGYPTDGRPVHRLHGRDVPHRTVAGLLARRLIQTAGRGRYVLTPLGREWAEGVRT